jgi:hypothetical protein
MERITMGIEIGFAIGALILAAAIVYGATQYRRRNRANIPITEQATRALYANEDQYARTGESEIRDQVKPS